MSSDISITLTREQALVIFELLARFEQTDVLRLHHNAEYLALAGVHGQLERLLEEPFKPGYEQLLSRAQDVVASGYEGMTPGVEPQPH